MAIAATLSQEVSPTAQVCITEHKFEGCNIFEWAHYAKKKARIASSICKQLGCVKALRTSCNEAACAVGQVDKDPLMASDPWFVHPSPLLARPFLLRQKIYGAVGVLLMGTAAVPRKNIRSAIMKRSMKTS